MPWGRHQLGHGTGLRTSSWTGIPRGVAAPATSNRVVMSPPGVPPFKLRIDRFMFCGYQHAAWFTSLRRRDDDGFEIVSGLQYRGSCYESGLLRRQIRLTSELVCSPCSTHKIVMNTANQLIITISGFFCSFLQPFEDQERLLVVRLLSSGCVCVLTRLAVFFCAATVSTVWRHRRK